MAKSVNKKLPLKEGKETVSFIIPEGLLNKVRYIAYREMRNNNSLVYIDAITKYVEQYEKANGKINP
ncbi:MAG: hypothetical protein WCF67_06465 [Chitinophagaceae bacterium]